MLLHCSRRGTFISNVPSKTQCASRLLLRADHACLQDLRREEKQAKNKEKEGKEEYQSLCEWQEQLTALDGALPDIANDIRMLMKIGGHGAIAFTNTELMITHFHQVWSGPRPSQCQVAAMQCFTTTKVQALQHADLLLVESHQAVVQVLHCFTRSDTSTTHWQHVN